jgi:ABC-type amino acid transport substrate-binding protein
MRTHRIGLRQCNITTTLSLVVRGAKTPAIRGLADLKDASVGVQAATTDYDAAVAMQKRESIHSTGSRRR